MPRLVAPSTLVNSREERPAASVVVAQRPVLTLEAVVATLATVKVREPTAADGVAVTLTLSAELRPLAAVHESGLVSASAAVVSAASAEFTVR